MRKVLSILCLGIFALTGKVHAQSGPEVPFEAKGSNYSATYAESIAFYHELEQFSPKVKLKTYQPGTDAGKPLHLVIISGDGKSFNPAQLRRMDKRILLINNGIHPGEPCGVDASMVLARDLVTDNIYAPLLEHIVVLIVPMYNVGGALNRGPDSRANQLGPENHGFRGNARLLDLNRDFIKNDSRNAQSFLQLFTEWKPDVFVDTHTSNGADYPYTMTFIPTQKDKFEPGLADYMETSLNPSLLESMAKADYEMCPYVQTKRWGMPPDSGLVGFLETPRYSTGLASLFNTIGYTTESHMLKSFEDRVYGTYHFLINLLKIINRDRRTISRLRKTALEAVKEQEKFTIRWKLAKEATREIDFKGYKATYTTSEVTGLPRLSYDREQQWRKNIPFYNTYEAEITVQKPIAYILPQSWGEVVQRMKWAGVKMKRLSEDSQIEVKVSYLSNWEVSKRPYEGHWPLNNIQLKQETQKINYLKGDYVIFCDQEANRYIIETLEPQAHDSWMHWNFFDEILGRKEYFSPYVFEKTAQEMLQVDPGLKHKLQEAINKDSSMVNNDWAQMDFIYKQSKHYEPTHLRYPVARLENKAKLPLAK